MVMNNCHIKADQAMTNDSDESHTMSSFLSDFVEIDALFFEFGDELNTTGGLSLLGYNSDVAVSTLGVEEQKHIRDGSFISQAADNAHSQPTPEGSQPLSGHKICETVLGRRLCYSKGLGWGPNPKSHKTNASSSSTTFSQVRVYELRQAMTEQQ
ncbi:cytochrome P450 CYP82D47-like [Cucumis melo var. makuwa]|uniref:Cytochrome P450 CYP82D47-like n=1 Tax=Cucumis melo var. makuwa TaxID=1194695 RepID=A0A5A7TTL8_CUCMM|nr:cytochrome P450 CYP82D47-like [Cucumis melo var. makuwa]TYK00243.1 cytochrome P450 CYP82D47-like [Cucumis melo var. makuwa]